MRRVALGCLTLALSSSAGAGWFGDSFSADAVQNAPQRPPMQGRMHVDEGRLRVEMNSGGQQQIQIMDPKAKKAWVLNPQQRQYMELPLPPAADWMASGDSKPAPCQQPGAECEKLGTESVNGRDAVKWQLKLPQRKAVSNGIIWTDAAHGFPVREQVGERLVSEMAFLGNETVAGRQTEKWQSRMSTPDGKTLRSVQWYDPKLNIAVRQQLPGGVTRELQNIKVGDQPDALFSVPEGFQRVEPQRPSNMAPVPRR